MHEARGQRAVSLEEGIPFPVMGCWHEKIIHMTTTLIDLFKLLTPCKDHLLNAAAAYFCRNKYTKWHHALLIQELLKHACTAVSSPPLQLRKPVL